MRMDSHKESRDEPWGPPEVRDEEGEVAHPVGVMSQKPSEKPLKESDHLCAPCCCEVRCSPETGP